MRIRRSSYKKYMPFILAVIFITICILTCILITQRNNKLYEFKIDMADNKLNENKRLVYAAINDLKKGQIISDEDVYLKEVIISDSGDIWIDGSYINHMLMIDVPKDMFITKNMLIDADKENKGLREFYISELHISPNISSLDYCDIRIMYPNGESYIVLSRKQIYGISEDFNSCCLWLNPEEYHLLTSGIVDCSVYDGSILILAKYINAEEDASDINYMPSPETTLLIYNETEKGGLIGKNYSTEERNRLEERIKNYQEE